VHLSRLDIRSNAAGQGQVSRELDFLIERLATARVIIVARYTDLSSILVISIISDRQHAFRAQRAHALATCKNQRHSR
jgi:hypothetical protein